MNYTNRRVWPRMHAGAGIALVLLFSVQFSKAAERWVTFYNSSPYDVEIEVASTGALYFARNSSVVYFPVGEPADGLSPVSIVIWRYLDYYAVTNGTGGIAYDPVQFDGNALPICTIGAEGIISWSGVWTVSYFLPGLSVGIPLAGLVLAGWIWRVGRTAIVET